MRSIQFILAFVLCISFSSCIKDSLDDCPLRILISVKDKNYFNTHEVDLLELKDENQNFNHYLSHIAYRLVNLDNGAVLESNELIAATSTQKEQELTFNSKLPFGKYKLTIWGGMDNYDRIPKNGENIQLHMNDQLGEDLYTDEILIDYSEQNFIHQMTLERITGKLILYIENLPSNYSHIQTEVSNLAGIVSPLLEYDLESKVNSIAQITQNQRYDFHLAPTIGKRETKVKIHVHAGNPLSGTESIPKEELVNFALNVERNKIYIYKIIYDGGLTEHRVQALIDSNWEDIHQSIIQ